MRIVDTPAVRIAFEEHGPADGPPVVLLHGFPYDVRAYDEVAPPLAERGCRVIVPFLRGFGPTRLRDGVPRSGEQAALGADLLALMVALELPPAVLAGYDWGGRAACVVAALWPERVRGLVSVDGYNIQDIAGSVRPVGAEQEHRLWYQYYLHSPRGRAGLEADREGFCRLLWRLWSPTWAGAEAAFPATAPSFDNPDFVDVVVQSYQHRFGYAPGDPALEGIEGRLAAQPLISVPAVLLHGSDDGVAPPAKSEAHVRHFTKLRGRDVVLGVGHNLPQEAPGVVVTAVSELLSLSEIG